MLKIFPILAIAAGLLGFQFDQAAASAQNAIVPLLMLVMFSMGMTLKWADFVALKHTPLAFCIGLILQFSVMPVLGLLIAMAFRLPVELQLGMVLVGSVAGGTASNVMSYLAKGNVALSVAMTSTSTLASILLTPFWLWLLISQKVNIPSSAMIESLLLIVLLPISAGLMANRFFGSLIAHTLRSLPIVSMLTILIIIAIVVGLNAERLATISLALVLAPLLHNVIGLLLGYLIAGFANLKPAEQRTVALEVGMQNSGLAAALAVNFFSALSALPAAIFSVWLNVTGAIFAAWVTRRDQQKDA